jgi:DNA modification methylase
MKQTKLKQDIPKDKIKFEHLNQAIPPEAHTPMYNVHRFFARKPHNVVRAYIDNYSDDSEIVLDPFCGSGVIVSESLKVGRRAVGIDLDPMATFITRMTIKPVNITEFKKAYKVIEKKIKGKINSFYITDCRKCKKKLLAINFVWDGDKPIEVGYECVNCGIKIRKPVDEKDLELLKKIDGMKIPAHPTNKLYYDDGSPFMKKEKYNSVEDLFTKRNLIALSMLFAEIKKIKDKNIRDFMEYTFTSISHLASRMTPDRPSRPFSSFWGQHSYWYVPRFMESNVWNLFEGRIFEKQGIIRGKEESNKAIKDFKEGKTFEDILKKKSNVLILNQSCIDALRKFESDSIDYVFTDPPYGGSIQYAELTYMWGSWLNFSRDFNERVKDEIIINRRQKKGFDEYYTMILTVFKEIYRVLKKGKYMTLTFHNPDIKIRNAIIRACVFAGFDFEKIIYQEPPRPSAKGLLQPFGSLQGDYFLRFMKPISKKESVGEEQISKERYKEIITDITEKIIAERGEPTHFTFIQNAIDPILYSELKKHGLLLEYKPEDVEKILQTEIGKRFVLVDTKVGKHAGKLWWLKNPESLHIDIIPLNKRVEETTINFLKSRYKASFTEILTELFTRYKNSLTPDSHSVMSILDKIANKTSGKMWTLKPAIDKIIKQHEEMVYYLAKLGEKAGFDIHIAVDEYGKTYDGKPLRELLNIKELKLDLPELNLNRIKRIDVLWMKNGKIIYEFDVEKSTNITDSIMRGSNIPYKETKRVVIIPKEYESLMNKVFNEPAIKEIVERFEWKIIIFDSLRWFYNKTKGDKTLDLKGFDELLKLPRDSIKEQKTLAK